MTTGTHPFRGDDQGQTIRRISSDELVTAPSAIVPGYPAGLEAVVMQSLAKDASKRYPTANDMLIGLTRALPPSMRPSTDEEVAAFLRALLPDRLEKRKTAIKAALEAADRREAGKSVPRMNSDSPEEPPTVLEGLVSNRETTPSAEGRTSLPGVTKPEILELIRDSRRARPRSLLSVGLSAALVIAVGAIVALLLSRRVPPSVVSSQQSVVPTSVSVTREPVPNDVPAVQPVETLPPAPSDSVAPPASATRTVLSRVPAHHVAVKPVKPVETSAPTSPRTGTFVSPIRNPGF